MHTRLHAHTRVHIHRHSHTLSVSVYLSLSLYCTFAFAVCNSLPSCVEQFPRTGKTYPDVQVDMNNTAVTLNQAASDIVSASRGTPQELATSSSRYSNAYEEFVHTGLTMAGLSKDMETQNQIVGGLKSVSMVSSKLLLAAKSVSADPNAPNAKNLLAQAARSVSRAGVANDLLHRWTVRQTV